MTMGLRFYLTGYCSLLIFRISRRVQQINKKSFACAIKRFLCLWVLNLWPEQIGKYSVSISCN
jgi:hypothetical protein